MRSASPQRFSNPPKPHSTATKLKSGIPRCTDTTQKGQNPLQPLNGKSRDQDDSHATAEDVYYENQLLGRLVQDMQAKLDRREAEVRRLVDDSRRHEASSADLEGQLEDYRRQLRFLQQEHETLRVANASLAEQHDRTYAQKQQLESVVVDLNLQLQHKDSRAAELQDRCDHLEQELQRLQSSTVTAAHVSQQISRVEAMYRSRVESIKEECREKLAAQEAATRTRLTEAQAATSQMMNRVKQAALREVQRAEAALEDKVLAQLRLIDQLSKRCRALESRTADMRPLAAAAAQARSRVVELERRLQQAEEAAAAAAEAAAAHGSGCCCCCCCDDRDDRERDSTPQLDNIADIQRRLADVRGELAAQAEVVAQLQGDLAVAQQGRVAAEERLEAVEATCRELRVENVALRTQLLAVTTHESARPALSTEGRRVNRDLAPALADEVAASLQREMSAHSAALRAAEADAASRELLQSARREQVAASRALVGQLRRMQALEAMRLNDLQELHDLERRLAHLRKELVDRRR